MPNNKDANNEIKVIKEAFPGITDKGIENILTNISIEGGGGKEVAYSIAGKNGMFTLAPESIVQNGKKVVGWKNMKHLDGPKKGKLIYPGGYLHNVPTMRANAIKLGFATGVKDNSKTGIKRGTYKPGKNFKKWKTMTTKQKMGVQYWGDANRPAGGYGPLQLTLGKAAGGEKRVKRLKEQYKNSGHEGDFNSYMNKIASDNEFGLRETLKYYKNSSPNQWNAKAISATDSTGLSIVINKYRTIDNKLKLRIKNANTSAVNNVNVYNNLDFSLPENKKYKPALQATRRDIERGLQEEYEKYSNELGSEGDEMAGEVKILSYEEWYKNLDNIGSPRAQKLKRDSLKDLGPRVEKVKEKEEEVEEKVVGKVDEKGKLDLTPTPVVPGTTISDEGEIDFGGHIQKQKDELNKKKKNEAKEKEKVYQPKKLVPLESLSDAERDALTNEERKEYGLEPLISEEEKAAREEEERLKFESEKAQDEEYANELQLKKEEEEKKKIKEARIKKASEKVVDKDGDGIPDTIDAQDAISIGPKNQLTVSGEEKEVIEEQEKEAIETVQTEEIEVLDANGNIKKITVPTVETPTTVETEGVTTLEKVVEEKPELVKPKLKDFKTSSDYMKARRQYFKSVGDDDALDFENELDDDEIKEAVNMEQNSTVIDASKRNIFKTNGKSNIFNSIIGNIDNLAKGIQQELNNITKSTNNKQ